MYYNILEPPKNWRSPHLSRAREVWQSTSFWLLLQAKSIGLVLKWVAEECFLKKCVFFVFDPLRSKNSYRGTRLKFYRRFEMFSTLENILHRYFEHKIEKNWTFHKVFKFPCFLLLKWAPKPSDRVAGSLKWHVLTLGVLSKNWGIRWFPKFFCRHFGSCISTY